MASLGLVWAQSVGGVIGAGGAIPWHLPEDLAHFRQVTLGATVIMGRRTWESLPERFRPLPGRRNLVLTRDRAWVGVGAEAAPSLEAALALIGPGSDAWVIGGGEVYAAALPLADRVELTEVDLSVDGDVLAPTLGEEWRAVRRDPEAGWATSAAGVKYRFVSFAPIGRGGGGEGAAVPNRCELGHI